MDPINLDAMPELPGFIASSVLRGRYLILGVDPATVGCGPVACAGWEECSADYSVSRSGFHFPAIEVIAGGEWELVTAMGKWVLGPGSVFTYGPGIAHSIRALTKDGLSKYFLDFSGAEAVQQLQAAGLEAGVPAMLLQRRWLHDLLDQLIDTARMREPARRRVTAMIARLILERLREDLHPVEQVTQACVTFWRCREYLATNYLHISNLSLAARKCGVSPVHLCRLFQRFGEESPRSFVTRLKINHAAERITRANLTVKAAAAEVGFDDPYHFSRVFKSIHGVPPSKFPRPGKYS